MDHFLKTGNPGTATTLSANYTIGDPAITVASTTNFPTDTDVIFAIDTAEVVNGEEQRVDGSYCVFYGSVASATSLNNLTKLYGTDQNYASGALTRVYITVSSLHNEQLIDGLLVAHNQDGSLIPEAVQEALGITASPAGGWELLNAGIGPDTITANGNGSYTLQFNGVDLTSAISAGMRLKTTRTVAAPIQCTSLNGTSQYYSKSSPAGMTETDDFVRGAWVKLSSYPSGTDGTIISKTNGTSGWTLRINSSGQVVLAGLNGGSANFSLVLSYQSIPLNKWVHIAAQLDMSTFTASTTTSYIMIDGIDIPASVSRGGTNPTALPAYTADFQIGAENGGRFFPGKIAQAFVSSAKITQANIKTLYSQGLTSALITANNIISAYSLSNSITDLNTTNANNLTAIGGAVATNADSPFGDSGTSTTLDYAIVMAKPVFSTNTTVTVQVPEGCTIPTSGGVSNVYYSNVDVPYAFPKQKGKWTLESLLRTDSSIASPVAGTWYRAANADSWKLTAPVGEWTLGYRTGIYIDAGATVISGFATLSQSTSAQDNQKLTTNVRGASNTVVAGTVVAHDDVALAAQTTYNMLFQSGNASSTLSTMGTVVGNIIYAENAYL